MNASEPTLSSPREPRPLVSTALAGPGFLRAKMIALGIELFDARARLRHRLGFGLRINRVDHFTIPCRDLVTAEAFYAGVLGARVLMRFDREFLQRAGRDPELEAAAIHTSVVFDSGSRIDLFVLPDAVPPAAAGHPHYAFRVSPRAMLRWRARLHTRGVPTFGPTRLGPPGQASLYFNDPFGNHLELVTRGFVSTIPIGPPDMSSLAYDWAA